MFHCPYRLWRTSHRYVTGNDVTASVWCFRSALQQQVSVAHCTGGLGEWQCAHHVAAVEVDLWDDTEPPQWHLANEPELSHVDTTTNKQTRARAAILHVRQTVVQYILTRYLARPTHGATLDATIRLTTSNKNIHLDILLRYSCFSVWSAKCYNSDSFSLSTVCSGRNPWLDSKICFKWHCTDSVTSLDLLFVQIFGLSTLWHPSHWAEIH